jgi:hypothetical protein
MRVRRVLAIWLIQVQHPGSAIANRGLATSGISHRMNLLEVLPQLLQNCRASYGVERKQFWISTIEWLFWFSAEDGSIFTCSRFIYLHYPLKPRIYHLQHLGVPLLLPMTYPNHRPPSSCSSLVSNAIRSSIHLWRNPPFSHHESAPGKFLKPSTSCQGWTLKH